MPNVWRIAMVAAVLAGCSVAPGGPDADVELVCTPGESRACACSSGASGAQICTDDGRRLGPCTCAELDGGTGGEDAGGERDAGAELDGGVDAGTDGGPRDAGPPWGECWLVPQAACESGEACRVHDPIFPERYPHCEPAGALAEGAVCMLAAGTRRDPCAPGMYCSGDTVASGRCRRYCDPVEDPVCGEDHLGDPLECLPHAPVDGHVWHSCRRP